MSTGGPGFARLLADWRAAAPGRPGYEQLSTAVRALVVDGRLPLGTRLPAERDLAARLGLSRTTVTTAYDLLREQGFLRTRRGAGTFATLPAGRREPWTDSPDAPLDLAVASPEALPDVMAAAVERAASKLPHHLGGHGYDALGLPALRQAVADRYAARGLPTSPDQVVVTAGALGGIGLVARALLAPGDRVLVDVPTYPSALDVVRRCGGRLAAVALGDDGWDLERTEAAYRAVLPRLGYLVADHANPTGHVLDADGRARMVRAAAGSTLVVDETLVDLALDGPLPPPVAASDDGVVTVGSVSKSHWGGLRVGWLRAPRPLVERFADTRATVDLAPPVLEQLVVTELLADPTAVPRQQDRVRGRRDALVAALREHAPDWTFSVPTGGLALWVRLDAPVATALSAAAARHGVRLVPGGRFTADGTAERWVRVPYALPDVDLREAVRRLVLARADLGVVPRDRPVAVA